MALDLGFQLNVLLVFVVTGAMSSFWTKYIDAVHRRAPNAAAFWDCAIVAGGALAVLLYVENPAMLIPALGGTYVGTFMTVFLGGKR